MKTNFFSEIGGLNLTGTIRLNIQPQPTGGMIVSLLLSDDKVKDKALQVIPPLVLKGDTNDLDEGFFDAIKTPVQQTSSLIANMSAYQTAIGKAQKESKEEKEKETNAKKDKDGKRKKFDEQMKKVEELEKQKKIGEAIGQLPDLKLFPEFAEEIKKKSQQLRSQHGTLSLFEEHSSSEATGSQTEEQEEETQPEDDDIPEDDPGEEDNLQDDDDDDNDEDNDNL